jgi:hypothetical protein
MLSSPPRSFQYQSRTRYTPERSATLKHIFLIAVLMHAACGRAFGDPAADERELKQLVKDLNEDVVKADITFLERVLHKD